MRGVVHRRSDLQQPRGNAAVRPVAQCPQTCLAPFCVRVGQSPFDDGQRGPPTDPPQRGKQGRLVAFTEPLHDRQQRLGSLVGLAIPPANEHHCPLRFFACRRVLRLEDQASHIGDVFRTCQLAEGLPGRGSHCRVRACGGLHDGRHRVNGVPDDQKVEHLDTNARRRALRLGPECTIDSLAAEPRDSGGSVLLGLLPGD